MKLAELINDKTIKPKEKTEAISRLLLSKKLSGKEIIEFANASKDPVKATCIEAIEFATKENRAIADKTLFRFVTDSLTAKAPRIKWESAKVIGNVARLFPGDLKDAIKNLLVNSEHEGTVVRWSAAFALGEILKLKTTHNKMLLPAIDAVCKREEKNSIRKIYQSAVKAVGA